MFDENQAQLATLIISIISLVILIILFLYYANVNNTNTNTNFIQNPKKAALGLYAYKQNKFQNATQVQQQALNSADMGSSDILDLNCG